MSPTMDQPSRSCVGRCSPCVCWCFPGLPGPWELILSCPLGRGTSSWGHSVDPKEVFFFFWASPFFSITAICISTIYWWIWWTSVPWSFSFNASFMRLISAHKEWLYWLVCGGWVTQSLGPDGSNSGLGTVRQLICHIYALESFSQSRDTMVYASQGCWRINELIYERIRSPSSSTEWLYVKVWITIFVSRNFFFFLTTWCASWTLLANVGNIP